MGVGAAGPQHLRRPLAATALLLALVAACTMPPEPNGGQPVDPRPGPTTSAPPLASLTLAIAPPISLDPRDLDTPDGLLLASQVFDGLVEYDPATSKAVPAIAEAWEVRDAGRTLLFRLRDDATFHDGTAVTADAFVTAWNRLADPIVSRPFAFLLEAVEGYERYQEELKVTRLSGVTALTPRVLEVRLSRAWPDFVAVLAHPALSPVPPPAPPDTFATQPVGTGPYRLASPLTPGSPVRLEAHAGYYGAIPAVPLVEYRAFDAPDDAWPEFLAGELDLAEIPADVLSDATSRFGSGGVVPIGRLLYCAFNQADERFGDHGLRLAVSLALDRDELVEAVFARLPSAATGIVPPSIPGHAADACGARCRHDPERAASLASAIPRKARTFRLDYAAGPSGDRLATAIAGQLADAGIRVTPRPHDATEYQELLEGGGHEMFCLVAVADYPRQQALLEPLLTSNAVDNLAGVEDPQLDALLAEARATLDAGDRERRYQEAERRALSAMHVVPVVWFRSHFAVQPHVEGLAVDALGRYDVARLTLSA